MSTGDLLAVIVIVVAAVVALAMLCAQVVASKPKVSLGVYCAGFGLRFWSGLLFVLYFQNIGFIDTPSAGPSATGKTFPCAYGTQIAFTEFQIAGNRTHRSLSISSTQNTHVRPQVTHTEGVVFNPFFVVALSSYFVPPLCSATKPHQALQCDASAHMQAPLPALVVC